jgi:sulfate permease, SulP family
MLAGLTRANMGGEILAGVTLLAIAIPEQLATSQLAGVPAFTALIAFIAAGVAFLVLGSNPILSVGADSTIAPLFAVALVRLAAPNTSSYLSLLAATAVVTGVLVAAVGALRLGWLADFLSLPIVGGFMAGIGVIIVVHQLPRVFGVATDSGPVASRLNSLFHHLGHVNAWSIALAVGTLTVMVVGERINPRWPTALVAVIGATLLSVGLSLTSHGVAVLGAVSAGLPRWRLHTMSLHDWGVVVTTSLTLLVVIISQSAATARSSSDDIGAADDIDRDFIGVGAANVLAGLVGAFPVNASPARTAVVGLAGGRTKMVGLVAVLGALVFSPLATYARDIPLAVLAGVLLFVAARLVKIHQLIKVLHTSRVEFALAMVSFLGVIILGVEMGLAIAVGLAILERTWRTARPRMYVLGQRTGTTSWEPLEDKSVEPVAHVLVVLFDESLYFANAGAFRRQVHQLLVANPETEYLVIDAVAMTDCDYTGLVTLAQVVRDITHDVSVSVARANDAVEREITHFPDEALRRVHFHNSVDSAVRHSLKGS